jgi:hypothetical protein
VEEGRGKEGDLWMAPKDIQVIIYGSCEPVVLHGRMDFSHVIKDLEMGDYIRLSGCSQGPRSVLINERGQVPVTHTCNPSYSGGRDQDNCGLKPSQANSSMRPYLEKPFTKIGLVEWLKVKAMSSSPSTTKKKKERKRKWVTGRSDFKKLCWGLWSGSNGRC